MFCGQGTAVFVVSGIAFGAWVFVDQLTDAPLLLEQISPLFLVIALMSCVAADHVERKQVV